MFYPQISGKSLNYKLTTLHLAPWLFRRSFGDYIGNIDETVLMKQQNDALVGGMIAG